MRISLSRDDFEQLVLGKVIKVKGYDAGAMKHRTAEICLQDIGYGVMATIIMEAVCENVPHARQVIDAAASAAVAKGEELEANDAGTDRGEDRTSPG